MKRYLLLFFSFAIFTLAYSNCSQTGFQSGSSKSSGSVTSSSSSVPAGITGGNVVSITVGCGYVNEPCVSVKICVPGSTTQCQTISNLLLDTGSAGLRIFSGATSLSLPSVVDNSLRPYGTCAVYGDGTYQWGPVKTADVYLSQDVAYNIPIEIVDFSFGDQGANCKALAGAGGIQDAMAAGYNGILGVQFFQQDCGSYCTTTASNDLYYGCNGTTCTSETVALSKQLVNPVSSLTTDYNGVILQFPSISQSGGVSVAGSMILGIGTQSNNTLGTPTVLKADANYGTIYTAFNGTNYMAVIDSGSAGYYFPDAAITKCSTATGWFCPSSTLTLSAVLQDDNYSVSKSVSFYVANAEQLYTPQNTFNDLAGPLPSAIPSGSIGFIWGFPFFPGRTVYFGIENTSSSLGAGPYFAF